MSQLVKNISLKSYNSFGIDARAKQFFEFSEAEQLISFCKSIDIKDKEVFILGGGSNVLFTKDFNGLILHPVIKGIEITDETDSTVLVKVGAGEIWDTFVEWAVNNNYYGIENLSLIPGYVGASPVQNIGAYGVEVKDIIESVETIDIYDLTNRTFSNKDCEFEYRDSIFKSKLKSRFLITHVNFRLKKNGQLKTHYGNIETELKNFSAINLENVRQAIINIRQQKLPNPNEIGNAGSFFKNPIVSTDKANELKLEYPNIPTYPAGSRLTKLAAGWLIEQSGWKGKSIGDAAVHKNQALVIVNKANAKGFEINNLADMIVNSVFRKFGISLEKEVIIL